MSNCQLCSFHSTSVFSIISAPLCKHPAGTSKRNPSRSDLSLGMANSHSCSCWCLIETATVFLPAIRFEVESFGFRRLYRSFAQRRVNTKFVVIGLEGEQFLFEISYGPKTRNA